MKIHKDDQVVIILGEDRGKKGRVLKVFPDQNKIIVEGINFVKRHTRASQKQPQGGIITKEGPIHVSNVMVICPKCGVKSKTGIKRIVDEIKGKSLRVRYCKKCNEMIVRAS